MSKIFWLPEKLLGYLPYPLKFLLVTILFMVPLVFVLNLYVGRANDEIKRISIENEGVSLADGLLNTFPSLIQARRYIQAPDEESSPEDLINSVSESLESLFSQHQDQPGINESLEKLLGQLANAEENISISDKDEMLAEMDALQDQVLRFLDQLIMEYKLDSLTEPTSTHLLMLSLDALPRMNITTTRLADQAIAVSMLGMFTQESFLRLNTYRESLISQTRDLQGKISILEHIDPQFSELMLIPWQETREQIDDLLNKINEKMILSDRIMLDIDSLNAATQVTLSTIASLQAETQRQLSKRLSEHKKTTQTFRDASLGIFVLTLSLAILVMFFLYLSITRVIRSFNTIAAAISRGDLSQEIEQSTRDEMSRLVTSLNQVIQNYRKVVSDSRGNAEMLLDSTRQLASLASLSKNESNQQKTAVLSIEKVMHQVNQLSDTVRNNASSSAESAMKSQQMTGHGKTVIEATTHTMMDMVHQTESANNSIKSLAVNVETIGEMSETIQAIAEQTNLLALNAAIEAARAGEQGRGFAVVADEVRTLSIKSQKSAEEISQQIDALEKETAEAVRGMDISLEQVHVSMSKVDELGVALNEMCQSVNNILQVSQESSDSASRQAELIKNLGGQIAQMAQTSERAITAASDVESTGTVLQKLAEKTEKSLKHFTV